MGPGLLSSLGPGLLAPLARLYMQGLTTSSRARVYAFTITYLSIVLASPDQDQGFLADPTNPINQYLVKFAWGWTLGLVALHLVLRGAREGARLGQVLATGARLALATAVWYCGARLLFPWLEEATGVCQVSQHMTRRGCYKAGFSWTGFDVSGHCFLLTFSNLFILEEVARESKNIAVKSEGEGDRRKEGEEVLSLDLALLCLLMLVWDVMLVSTSLYFHSTLEKVLGWLCGLGAWHLLYKRLYPGLASMSRGVAP